MYSRDSNDWTLQLPELFAEESLLNAMLYHFWDLPQLARANGEQHLSAMEEFASSLAKTDHREEATKIFKPVQDAGCEVLNVATLSMPRMVCVGRKASAEVKCE